MRMCEAFEDGFRGANIAALNPAQMTFGDAGAQVFARITSYISSSLKLTSNLLHNITNAITGNPWIPQPRPLPNDRLDSYYRLPSISAKARPGRFFDFWSPSLGMCFIAAAYSSLHCSVSTGYGFHNFGAAPPGGGYQARKCLIRRGL